MVDPKLSVIVVCLNSTDVRKPCLKALKAQANQDSVEVLVVGHFGDGDSGSDVEHVSPLRWISISPENTVPQMRTCAILQSQGELIALLEDDCVVPEGWISKVIQSHTHADTIIGGAIAPGEYRRFLDWAVFFCEYGRFMPPFSGLQNALPGNHVIYKKTALPALKEGEGFYEVFFHDSWQSAGGRLIADPNLVVENVNHWSSRHLTNIPYHHGRAFAGMRSQNFPVWRRGLYTILSLVLPIVKAARLAAVVFNRKQYRSQFILSLPWIMIFFISWSFGELVGYAAGPGLSVEQWR